MLRLRGRRLHEEEQMMAGGWGRSGDEFTGCHGGTFVRKKD